VHLASKGTYVCDLETMAAGAAASSPFKDWWQKELDPSAGGWTSYSLELAYLCWWVSWSGEACWTFGEAVHIWDGTNPRLATGCNGEVFPHYLVLLCCYVV